MYYISRPGLLTRTLSTAKSCIPNELIVGGRARRLRDFPDSREPAAKSALFQRDCFTANGISFCSLIVARCTVIDANTRRIKIDAGIFSIRERVINYANFCLA